MLKIGNASLRSLHPSSLQKCLCSYSSPQIPLMIHHLLSGVAERVGVSRGFVEKFSRTSGLPLRAKKWFHSQDRDLWKKGMWIPTQEEIQVDEGKEYEFSIH